MINKIKLQLFAEEGEAETKQEQVQETVKEEKAEKQKEEKAAQVPKYTDEDVNRILDKKFAKWQEKQQQAVDEAKKLEKMNATQKIEYERDKLQKELDELKKAASLAEMSKTARKMLAEENITISDELLSLMVTTDAEKTKTAIDSFSKTFKEAVESAVKERIKGEPPKRGTGGKVGVMTKQEIMQIADPELRQQKMLENKELFNF